MALKPQVRSAFATPVCVHFLPVAAEANAELRPLILERMQAGEPPAQRGRGWRSNPDFDSWGGTPAQTLFRVLRELADSLSVTRTGARVNLDWRVRASAAVRQKGESSETRAHPGAFWAGVYYVDDGYAKSDDAELGGEYEMADPRGALPAMVTPGLAFRLPGGLTAGLSETIRPQSGMIVMHPAWVPSGERRYDGGVHRVTIEFEIGAPEGAGS